MGGKSGGGGSVDTSGLERATREATELQREIFEQTTEDFQPWYNVGRSGISRLSDLLGLKGGSIQSREQIREDLLPEFTTNTSSSEQTGMWQGLNGALYSSKEDAINDAVKRGNFGGDKASARQTAEHIVSEYAPQTIVSSVDYNGLNAAIEEKLAGQAETPEGYGSLLERFSLDDFEQDPGYQFRQEEANKALERSLSAQGVTLGGGGVGEINPQVARAMQELNQNLASQEYGNAYNRYNADQANIFNRLMGVSGMGQGTAVQLANTGQQYATNTSNLNTGLAQAQLEAQMAADAQPSMFDTLLNAGTQLGSAYLLAGSDRRIKENIKELPRYT